MSLTQSSHCRGTEKVASYAGSIFFFAGDAVDVWV